MSKIFFSPIFACIAVLANNCPVLANPSPKEIMSRNEDARRLDDVAASATLTTGAPGASPRVKEFTWWRKLSVDRIHYNTLTRFHFPAEIRGEGILFLEHGSDQNDVMMYLPNFKKIRRVESQQQSGSFMGSEFSYSDIATPHVDDYRYSSLKEEPCPGQENANMKCTAIETIPATDAVRERTGYLKSVYWIRQDNFMNVRAETYGQDGGLWKTMVFSDIRQVDPSKKKWMALHIRVENARSSKFTVLRFNPPKVNSGIHDSVFTQQNLARER